jgi:hypothetical protein
VRQHTQRIGACLFEPICVNIPINEAGCWTADAIERQLAHVEANAVRGAYARGEYWDKRLRMMVRWADYLDQLKNVGAVIPLD